MRNQPYGARHRRDSDWRFNQRFLHAARRHDDLVIDKLCESRRGPEAG
jgi:predicted RNA methylase